MLIVFCIEKAISLILRYTILEMLVMDTTFHSEIICFFFQEEINRLRGQLYGAGMESESRSEPF